MVWVAIISAAPGRLGGGSPSRRFLGKEERSLHRTALAAIFIGGHGLPMRASGPSRGATSFATTLPLEREVYRRYRQGRVSVAGSAGMVLRARRRQTSLEA